MYVYFLYLVFWDDETVEKVSAVILFRFKEVEAVWQSLIFTNVSL
jgi:hypothetical protein